MTLLAQENTTETSPVTAPRNSLAAIQEYLDATEEYEEAVEPENEEDSAEDAPAPGGEPEEAAAPVEPEIAPPVSWKDEDKALFSGLPAEVQKVVAAREAERERAVQAKMQEAATVRKTAHVEAAKELQALAETYVESLAAFMQADLPAYPDESLLEQDPAEYLRQERRFQSAIAQRQTVQQEIEKAKAQKSAAEQYARDAFYVERQNWLVENLPGWADNAEKMAQEIASFAQTLGYDNNALSVADGRDVRFLHEAMTWRAKAEKYDAIQNEKMAAVRAAKTLPSVSKPGAVSTQTEKAAARSAAAWEQVKSAKNQADKVSAFADLLAAKGYL
jgi:hypothetical protein